MRTSSFALDALDITSNNSGGRKKASSVSLGGDLRSLLMNQSNSTSNHNQANNTSNQFNNASSRTASLSGMSILLLPVAGGAGVDLSRGSGVGLGSKGQRASCVGGGTGINEGPGYMYRRVDGIVLALCAVGDCLTVIGACTALHGNWSQILVRNFGQYHQLFREELRTTKTLIIMSAVSGFFALISGIFKLRSHQIDSHRKLCHLLFISMLIASFLSSLVSIAVWADLITHGHIRLKSNHKVFPNSPKLQEQLFKQTNLFQHNYIKSIRGYNDNKNNYYYYNSNRVTYGWSYWVTVSGSMFQFLANVCHLIRRDCHQKRRNYSMTDDFSSQSDDGVGDEDDTASSVNRDRNQRRSLSAASFSAVVGVGTRFSTARFNRKGL